MPKKKKNVENGFSLFMREKMPELKRQGYTFPNGFQDVPGVAHPIWKALSEHERKQYNDRAKAKKAVKGNLDADDRIDSTGYRVSDRVDITLVEDKRREEQHNWAKKWPPGTAVVEEVFYLLGIQTISPAIHLVVPGTSESQELWLPAEIAITEYKLSAGKMRTMHKFIKPGPIPTGWSYECHAHTEKTNKIPVSGHEESEENYTQSWMGVCQFLNPQRERTLPHVLVQYDERNKVEACLAWLAARAGMPNLVGKVFTLEYFIVDLYNHINRETTIQAVNSVLSRTVFDFVPGTCCNFHEQEEVAATHCALGTVNKYSYMISDLMASEYGIELTGRHLPERGDGPPIYNVLPMFRADNRPLFNKPVRPSNHDINAVQQTTTLTKLQRQVNERNPEYLDADGATLMDARAAPVIPASASVPEHERDLRLPANTGFASQITVLQQSQAADAWPELGAEVARKPRIKQKKQNSPGKQTFPPPSPVGATEQQQSYNNAWHCTQQGNDDVQAAPLLIGRGVPVQRYSPPRPGSSSWPQPQDGASQVRVGGTMPVFGRGAPPAVIGRGRGILPPPGFSNRDLEALTSELGGLGVHRV